VERAPVAPQQQPSRKRSRKDIERALRRGNLAAVDGAANLQEMQQEDRSGYQPAEETYAVPVDGVRAVPTAMYDPSEGRAVTGYRGARARGRNQINQLMSAAADLELQRARGLAAPSASAKAHRASAKRKYGF
jgi:hypothetical protein